jgi:flagellar basal body-associated protein FliL
MPMPINEQLPAKAKAQEPMNISTIMIVVALVLFAVGLAYSQGWFDSWYSSTEVKSNTVGASQTVEEEKPKEEALKLTRETAQPADTTTK